MEFFFYANTASWTDFPTSDSRRIGQASARIFQEDLRVKLRTSVVLASRDFRNSYGETFWNVVAHLFPLSTFIFRGVTHERYPTHALDETMEFFMCFSRHEAECGASRYAKVRHNYSRMLVWQKVQECDRKRSRARARTFSPFNPCCIRGFFLSSVFSLSTFSLYRDLVLRSMMEFLMVV